MMNNAQMRNSHVGRGRSWIRGTPRTCDSIEQVHVSNPDNQRGDTELSVAFSFARRIDSSFVIDIASAAALNAVIRVFLAIGARPHQLRGLYRLHYMIVRMAASNLGLACKLAGDQRPAWWFYYHT